MIARLASAGLVGETDGSSEPHPGLARRYYELTAEGRMALADEARRLEGAAALALQRLGARP